MCTVARTIALLPPLLLVTAVTVLTQTSDQGSFDLLSVDVTDQLAGRSIDHIQRGAVRVRWQSDGPQLFLNSVRLPPTGRRSAAPSVEDGCLVLSQFDYSSRNRLGGSFFTFDREPSAASAELSTSHERVLQLDYTREEGGFAGLAIQLYDPEPLEGIRYYLDARSFRTLSFEVRGRVGRERIRVRMSDARSNERETAHELGELSDLIESGRLTSTWQRAVIDLENLPLGLDRDEFDKLVLLPAVPGTGAIEIDDVQLCSPENDPQNSRARAGPRLPEQRALWVVLRPRVSLDT